GLFRNVCVKPNTTELLQATRGEGTAKEREAVKLAGLVRGTVFFTDGPNGIVVCEKDAAKRVPAFPVTGPIDICGAGDSTSAGIASAMVSGATHEQAAAFGNLVASITIQQIGVTGTASPEQARARWREVGS